MFTKKVEMMNEDCLNIVFEATKMTNDVYTL